MILIYQNKSKQKQQYPSLSHNKFIKTTQVLENLKVDFKNSLSSLNKCLKWVCSECNGYKCGKWKWHAEFKF